MNKQKKNELFERLSKEAESGGGHDKISKQHASSKYTARERIDLLLDKGTFSEIDKFARHFNSDFGLEKKRYWGDGVVTGYGNINGRLVYVFAQDFTVLAGTVSRTNANKIKKIMEMALKNRAPIIGIKDSGGARIQEGVDSMAGYADIFHLNVECSGIIPQISLIMGPCAGGAVYSPALTDYIIMVKNSSYMFLTGPDVIRSVIGEEITKDVLGGAITHNTESGVAHLIAEDENESLSLVRKLLSFLPSNNDSEPPLIDTKDDINRLTENILNIIPEDPRMPYDIKEIIKEVFDRNSFLEIQPLFAENIVIGFARIGGLVTAIVANQPMYLAGVLDIDASVKAARFIRFCDAFNIPIITLVDVPGFLPGVDQEYNGIIKHGAKLMYAYSEASVQLITLIIRKAYGGAYDVMASKHLKADLNLAYPTAEIAVMGAEGAINILFRDDNEADKEKHIIRYKEKFYNPYIAAEKGYIDQIVIPKETRKVLYRSLMTNKGKRVNILQKKHGNIPL